MTRLYKGYKIETVTRVESEKWEVWANITPVSAIPTSGALSMSKSGYDTREEAETAVWEKVKKKIDEVIR